MKSFHTRTREFIKNSILILDYFIWLIFDFSKFKKIKKEKIKKVLIVHLGSIGELMVTTPLLPILKKELNGEITFMVNKGKDLLFYNNPYVTKIIFPKKGFFENIKQLKKEKFDLGIILYPGSFKMSLMALISKIKYRIGCFAGARGFPIIFFNKRIFPIQKKHAVHKNLDIIRLIGLDSKNPRLEYYPTKEEYQNLKKFLKKNNIKEENYAIVHPGFSSSLKNRYPSRLWPLNRYSETIDYIIEKYNLPVFLTGSENEIELSKFIKKTVKKENQKKVIIVNKLFDLRGLATLISKSKLLVSCGTGIVHIAAAFNINSVVFEGKGSPIEWSPWNPKNNWKILFHPEVCTECDLEQCRKKNTECMKAIKVEEVKNAIDLVLRK